jgi:enoyl-[acyl-carrier-protein] reductase (NADH)
VEEVANAVAFLVSDHASYISGEALRIDAGFMGALRRKN